MAIPAETSLINNPEVYVPA